MLRMKKISECMNLKTYTDSGEYFGDVEDAIITKNKVDSWKIKATRESFLSRALQGAKGVIIPHHFVKAVGDVMIISRSAAPSYSDEDSA